MLSWAGMVISCLILIIVCVVLVVEIMIIDFVVVIVEAWRCIFKYGCILAYSGDIFTTFSKVVFLLLLLFFIPIFILIIIIVIVNALIIDVCYHVVGGIASGCC